MRLESPSFTSADLLSFVEHYQDRERQLLAERLAAASARLQRLAGRLDASGPERTDDGWTAVEVLAHIATVSKFYGVLVYRVGTGQLREVDLLETVRLRDPATEQMAQLPVADLLAQVGADHQRTLAYLRKAPAADLERTVDIGGGNALSAIDIARMPLVAHLEEHVDQLERELP